MEPSVKIKKEEDINKIFKALPDNSCRTVEKGGRTFVLCKDRGKKRFFELI